jgi:hypothetical protein
MSDAKCNCPDLSRMLPNEVAQSKYPCPVHDTPENLAKLAKFLLPREPGEAPAVTCRTLIRR